MKAQAECENHWICKMKMNRRQADVSTPLKFNRKHWFASVQAKTGGELNQHRHRRKQAISTSHRFCFSPYLVVVSDVVIFIFNIYIQSEHTYTQNDTKKKPHTMCHTSTTFHHQFMHEHLSFSASISVRTRFQKLRGSVTQLPAVIWNGSALFASRFQSAKPFYFQLGFDCG